MWHGRLSIAALICAGFVAHAYILRDIPNTLEWMLVFHGTAAAFDLLILFCARFLLSDDIRTDFEILSLLSALGNFLGWIAYILYYSPIYYDNGMYFLAIITALRLIIKGDHERHIISNSWLAVVRGWYRCRVQPNFERSDKCQGT